MVDLLPGFADERVRTSGAEIRVRHGGAGPPLLLLHGNPMTHVSWHKLAPGLAERFHVVATDLRGYGDSSAPEPGEHYEEYSFRALARDQVEVMAHLGYERFFVAGHDRGARTAHRMALDDPQSVAAAAVLDILPTHYLWTNPSFRWLLRTWHWPFMAQPPDFPERMLGAVPARWFMEKKLSRPDVGLTPFHPAAFEEYVRCFNEKTIRGSCHEYRAAAGIDFELDCVDHEAGRRVTVPLLVLWGERSHPYQDDAGFLAVWQDYAEQVECRMVPCGHYVPEEAPDAVLDAFLSFFAGAAADPQRGG